MHVAILDIDDFKGINDRFGHLVGDKILISVAETFVRLLTRHGRLVRLGGDEFLIVFCGDGIDELIDDAIAELQRGALTSDLVGHGTVTLSAGIAATEPDEHADLETLYKRADTALYDAKLQRPAASQTQSALTRTGTWQL